jgi:YggT family protein
LGRDPNRPQVPPMHVILNTLIEVILIALNLYWYVILASVIVSWLVAFGVINTYSPAVRTIMDVIYRLTEPALRPIRRVLPDFGAVDLSPVALWLILYFLIRVLEQVRFSL